MAMIRQKIVPHLWFDKQAREAVEFYCSVFPDSSVQNISQIRDTPSGDCDFVSFQLCGQDFKAISAGPFFKFNEAISFQVFCDSQDEIDFYWQKLSADPAAEQCGWLKDKFGLSWQIVPSIMDVMMESTDSAQIDRVTQSFLGMKKFDIAELQRAFDGV